MYTYMYIYIYMYYDVLRLDHRGDDHERDALRLRQRVRVEEAGEVVPDVVAGELLGGQVPRQRRWVSIELGEHGTRLRPGAGRVGAIWAGPLQAAVNHAGGGPELCLQGAVAVDDDLHAPPGSGPRRARAPRRGPGRGGARAAPRRAHCSGPAPP